MYDYLVETGMVEWALLTAKAFGKKLQVRDRQVCSRVLADVTDKSPYKAAAASYSGVGLVGPP